MFKYYLGYLYLLCILVFILIKTCNATECIKCFTYPICPKCANDETCVIVEPDCHSCGSADCVKKATTADSINSSIPTNSNI
ncbi:unnamed protein product [Rhizophagus irregularis]|uniref:Membrane anchor Opy2 N-terminal domain-containing protein n=1 Tax=Rhizophagus irregularis TaxID=588596 RepID=A0A2I1GA01_9GLOM|nr:hypothetical protein RhiirA4_398770 [Rhizophagus irregularis]CAB4411989.1 unnamed protein product [Rhizophagus irregularis]